MKILFVSQTYLRKDLGAAKVVMELAEEMERVGWQCDLESLPSIVGDGYRPDDSGAICQALRRRLIEVGDRYDVIDYDHVYLPFPRREFSERPLFVARSILLHRPQNPIPQEKAWRSRVRRMVLGSPSQRQYDEIVRTTRLTVAEADLINVANHDDAGELRTWGLPADKVTIHPYGLSRERHALFAAAPTEAPANAVVAFIGTFDQRKGAGDFPRLVRDVCDAVPGASFLLLGTGRTERDVLNHFPIGLRRHLRVIPTYDPARLPDLVAGCSVGVFPSYLESFGFGVLEMLAAAIPVVSYDCPGPPMMLPPSYLVPRGAVGSMAKKVSALLINRDELAAARLWAKQRAVDFSWKAIAKETSEVYRSRFQHRATGIANRVS